MDTFLASDDDVVSQLSSLDIFDYIIVGSGIGGGILAEELLKKGNKNVLLIEKGDATFSTHVCNTARPSFARGKQDSPEGNETIYNKLKSWVQTAEDSEPYVGGPLHCLGGRSVVWGLWIPRADEKTLDDHFPAEVALDLKTKWFQEAFDLVTNNSQKEKIYPEGYIDVQQLNTSRAELTEAIEPFMLENHPVELGPVAIEFHSPAPYSFPQGAYSTAVPLLNRIYARDRRLTVLLNTEVLNVDFTRPKLEIGAANAAVVSLTVRRVSTQKISKIFVGKAKVILSAGTINTASIALNSGIQFLDKSKETLVGKGLIDHAVWGVRFAKLLEPLASPRSPINFQNMIKICGTTALLTVTVNNNFFLAGSSSLPIHQYLDETGEEVSPIAEGRNRSFEDNNVETIAVLLEFGAKLRDDNEVFSSGSINPVIRMKREETHADEECQIYMQTLATSIRNTVITRILPAQPEQRMPLPWSTLPENHGPQDFPSIIPNLPPLKVSRPTSDSELEGDELKHSDIPILHRKLRETVAPRLSLLGAGIFAHEVGTMRMDAPPGPSETNVQGVVDTNLLVHGFSNLYVCDLSVFPYSPEANPTLTLAAISMRLADHLHSMNSN